MDSSRRDILKLAGLAAIGARAARAQAGMADVRFEPKAAVRIGVIGVGGRGNSLIDNFVAVQGVSIGALCDVVEEKCKRAQAKLDKSGKASRPIALYTSGERAFEDLVKRDDLDLIVVATPWVWHAPMAVAAMKQGKHVAVEVPAARTLAECWDLVDTSEATGRHCVQLENCCYGYNELLVLNMVRAGLFGELTHGGAAYNHDLRSILFSPEGEGQWRRFEHLNRNGNLYPTHGLGPVARYMDVNRGDRFDTLVSMSSISAGLQAYRRDKLQAGDPRQKETYTGRRFQRQPDPYRERPGDRARAQRQQPAALRPHQPDRRDEGHLPRLPAAHLLRWRARRRVRSARPLQGKIRASACGPGWGRSPKTWAATAAWTSSWPTG